MKIAYDGSCFNGFAKNYDGDKSVSSHLTSAFARLGITNNFVAAGRTDKFVHATGQVISMQVPDFWELSDLAHKLNKKLNPSVQIRRIWEVKPSFHARFSAKIRKYRYLIAQDTLLPFFRPYICELNINDIEALKEALAIFKGMHDFEYFAKSAKRGDFKNTKRKIYDISCYKKRFLKQEIIVINISANAFLYAQIRMMLGGVFAYLQNKLTLDDLRAQLALQKRNIFTPASPNGLYLCNVIY